MSDIPEELSVHAKIDRVVEIWIEKGSLSPTAKKKSDKYNEILEKVLDGTYSVEDLDKFIHGHESGEYK